ncbi:hypothetical protein G9P44_005856 [Scheffersomyces stipitis]|nr:hypothetical protein G9P44_005856 [Scheffersomyces stipitis]
MQNSAMRMSPPVKRTLDLPSPKSLARLLDMSYKRQKIATIPRSMDESNTSQLSQDISTDVGKVGDSNGYKVRIESPFPGSFDVPLPPRISSERDNVPLLHNVPPTMIPIVQEPSSVEDFFTDLTTDMSDHRRSAQISGIVNRFPPPLPPLIPRAQLQQQDDYDEYGDPIDKGGIFVPFIFPPPPVINPATLPYSLESFRPKPKEQPKEKEKEKENETNTNENTIGTNITNESNTATTNTYNTNTTTNTYTTTAINAYQSPEVLNEQKPAGVSETTPAAENLSGNQVSPLSDFVYLQVPPLPFPPPNYMPYPINADKSTLTPHEVFGAFIDANEELPRIDMVVASAAGSLFDMKAQASEEGFTIQQFEETQKQKMLTKSRRGRRKNTSEGEEYDENLSMSRNGSEYSDDNRSESDFLNSEGERDEGYSEYVDYVRKIDTRNYYDQYDKTKQSNSYELSSRSSEFAEIKQRTSNVKSKRDASILSNKEDKEYSSADLLSTDGEQSEGWKSFLPISTSKVLSNTNKDISSANGSNKEKRRLDLVQYRQELEEYEKSQRFEIYRAKKMQLLERLKNLQESKISFTNLSIKDEELQRYKDNLDIERDEELVRLKLVENYELLKNSLTFYQDSNRVYKHLNTVLINKLEKLKNFFEYQRDLFINRLNNSNADVYDIKSKDAGRLYSGISTRDFGTEIKQTIKKSLFNEVKPEELAALAATQITTEDLTKPARKEDGVLVHDYMALITPAEFDIITGDLPVKAKGPGSKESKQSTSAKHKIFQNSLYEKITSGSDTNASDSNSSVGSGPKRRGRRANVPPTATGGPPPGGDRIKGDGPDYKYSEAALLAKIMKQFNGPQAARPDELNYDLDMMGVRTRWPVPR